MEVTFQNQQLTNILQIMNLLKIIQKFVNNITYTVYNTISLQNHCWMPCHPLKCMPYLNTVTCLYTYWWKDTVHFAEEFWHPHAAQHFGIFFLPHLYRNSHNSVTYSATATMATNNVLIKRLIEELQKSRKADFAISAQNLITIDTVAYHVNHT